MGVDDSDSPLVSACQNGDESAFDQLMNKHQNSVLHFISRHISNEADALDITQEAFVKAYFHIHQYRPDGMFRNWLFQIALNLCRDLVRSKSWRNRQQTDSLYTDFEDSPQDLRIELASRGGTPSEMSANAEDFRLLQQAIDKLPLEMRGPLLLTASDGLSHLEAANQLGITVKAVETRVYRARKLLAELLKSHE